MAMTITTSKQISLLNHRAFSFFTIGTFALLLSNCATPTEETAEKTISTGPKTIVIDEVPLRKDVKVTDLISDYEYIPLETSEEVLVGNISSIAFDHDRIFIHDQITNALHVFTSEGKFIHKLSALGKGPGEFTQISSFTLDQDQRRIIISANLKIMTFDYDGNFIKEFKLAFGAYDVGYSGKNKLLVYSDFFGAEIDSTYYQAVVIDLETEKIVSSAIPYNPNARMENGTGFWRNISGSDSHGQYLSVPYKNMVWRALEDSIAIAYTIDFGEDGLPNNYEVDYLSNPKYSSDDLRTLEERENWRRLRGGGLTYGTGMIYFYYVTKDKAMEVYHDLNTNKSFQAKPITNDLDGTRFIAHYTTHNGKFVSYISPSALKANVANGKITEERIIELAEGLEEEDNPVLRLLTFKPIE